MQSVLNFRTNEWKKWLGFGGTTLDALYSISSFCKTDIRDEKCFSVTIHISNLNRIRTHLLDSLMKINAKSIGSAFG